MSRLNYFQTKPKALKINIDTYLNRLCEKREAPSFNYLKRLHRAHLLHVPFENLDIHFHHKIVLDFDKIFQKIVTRKRGGYCYELNGLFYHLLFQLGFEVKIISASFKNEQSGLYDKVFEHMAIIAAVDGAEYLIDVGLKKGMIYPKKLEIGLVQMDYADYWKVDVDADENYILKFSKDTRTYVSKYLFKPDPREIIQFHEMNEYQQSDPKSHFTQNKLITQLTETGRKTLTDSVFIELKNGVTHENAINNDDEFLALLHQHFGISKLALTYT